MNSLPAAVQGISALDIGVVLLLLVFALRCAFRGFVREIMAVAGLLVAVAAGLLFSSMLAPVLEGWLGKTVWNQFIAFGIIFLLASLLMLLLNNALRTIVEGLNLHIMDHFLGFLLGAVEGLFIVFLLFFLLNIQEAIPLQHELDQSVAFKLLSPFFSYANGLIHSVPGSIPLPLPKGN